LEQILIMPVDQEAECEKLREEESYNIRDNIQESSFNNIVEGSVKTNETFIIKLTKGIKIVDEKCKEICKVLHFPAEWNYDEITTILDGLDIKIYPNLFIFIVELNNFDVIKEINSKTKKLEEKLINFAPCRPLVLQLISKHENISNIYYKEEMSSEFFPVNNQQQNQDLLNFETFLSTFMNATAENFEHELISNFSKLHYSSLILRFLRTLDLSDDFFECMILEMSKKGSKSEFFAALDVPFDSNGRMISTKVQKYLETVFIIEEEVNESEQECAKRISFLEPTQEKPSINSASESSVLLTAIEYKNAEIIDYLITYWTHLIQQLPFEHQVKISTAAFETNQLDIFCDLLEFSDFPFPENFIIRSTPKLNHPRLLKLTEERLEFKNNIESEKLKKIDEFVNKNSNLKNAYIPSNKSAMQHAVDSKKYQTYFHLKSVGFWATEFDNLEDVLTEEELKEANRLAANQRRKNVRRALSDSRISVHLLFTRSFIHNRKINKEQEAEYRIKIKNWYEDISRIKFGIEFLDAAASCEDLKIIFDFESDTVSMSSF